MNGTVAGGVFAASLLGSLHCVGMCGPLVALCTAMPGGEPRRGRGAALHAAHALGRLGGYAAIGALAGAAGSAIDLAGAQAGIARAAGIGAGVVVVLAGLHGLLATAGLRMLPVGGGVGRVTRWIAPAIAALRAQPPVPRAALVGLLSAGLPCGWLWAFVVVAAGTASAASGAWTMVAFWAGMLDDGRIVFEVTEVEGSAVRCRVVQGGELSNNKGINRKGGGLTAPALTAKDMEDIRTAAKMKADYVAVSFPKSSADMYMARQLLRAAGSDAFLIAKIERAEAVVPEALSDIMASSDGIMVARGDLAVEVGDASVPALQKRMIRMAREKNKLTITATQMMESMISSPVPTRAEVSDVANAVLDGTDAVMLSAETASGQYPVEVIDAMDRICIEAEQTQPLLLDQEFLNRVFTRVDQSIAMAALFTAYHLKVKAIAALTESGATALWMSRLNCGVPIYALTSLTSTRYRCAMFRDTYPVMMKHVAHDREELLRAAEDVLVANGMVNPGDLIVLTIGEPIGKAGGTNTMKIVKIGDHRGR